MAPVTLAETTIGRADLRPGRRMQYDDAAFVPDTVSVHDGPNTDDLTEEALARLFADPGATWGNLEIAVHLARGHAAIHWTGFGDVRGAVGAGFLVRHEGESPLGAHDSPEAVRLLDGGSEPFEVTARHLLDLAAAWLVWQLGRRGRPARWPDGRPLTSCATCRAPAPSRSSWTTNTPPRPSSPPSPGAPTGRPGSRRSGPPRTPPRPWPANAGSACTSAEPGLTPATPADKTAR